MSCSQQLGKRLSYRHPFGSLLVTQSNLKGVVMATKLKVRELARNELAVVTASFTDVATEDYECASADYIAMRERGRWPIQTMFSPTRNGNRLAHARA